MTAPRETDEIRVTAKQGGFFYNLFALSVRSLKSLPRDPESVIPALFIPAFFYIVNIGIFSQFVGDNLADVDYEEFQLPVAILFAVTGISRASVLVLDIQNGYFDRLALAPVNRIAMILGLIVADIALIVILTIPVLLLGLAFGVVYDNIFGILVIFLIVIGWAFVYNGITYGIAFKTGNPAIVNTSFILFFPIVFFSTLYLPLEQLTGWLRWIATFNPTTYVLDGMRTLLKPEWDWSAVGYAFLAIAIVGSLTVSFALWGLNARLRRS